MIKTYSELLRFPTFSERLEYLMLYGKVCEETFGGYRAVNQLFYSKSREWKYVRQKVIIRDLGCDLGLKDHEIVDGRIIVHHMNPLTIDDFKGSDFLLNPEYLICVSQSTHQKIHYGYETGKFVLFEDRRPNDTCPWR